MGQKKLQCTPKAAQEVARYSSQPGGSLDEEMREFAAEFPIESLRGFYNPYSEGGVDEIITDREEVLAAMRASAEALLGTGEGDNAQGREAADEGGRDFLDLRAAATTPEGGIDLARFEQLGSQGPVRTNGGVRCDVTSGPCSCGAWH